jgi:hypothetical protein
MLLLQCKIHNSDKQYFNNVGELLQAAQNNRYNIKQQCINVGEIYYGEFHKIYAISLDAALAIINWGKAEI